MDTIWGNLNRARLSYEGEWLNGLPHGNGKLVFQDGTIYVGEFFENDFHGKGGGVYPDCWDELDDNWSALPDLNRSPAVRSHFSY
ncbi:hypothetical protein N8809_05470 [Euryarchaeota archaeon]|nr:hypothetical protein [Euryarchaeota archaeon]